MPKETKEKKPRKPRTVTPKDVLILSYQGNDDYSIANENCKTIQSAREWLKDHMNSPARDQKVTEYLIVSVAYRGMPQMETKVTL